MTFDELLKEGLADARRISAERQRKEDFRIRSIKGQDAQLIRSYKNWLQDKREVEKKIKNLGVWKSGPDHKTKLNNKLKRIKIILGKLEVRLKEKDIEPSWLS